MLMDGQPSQALRALRAADASLATCAEGARTGTLVLEEAARIYGAKIKYTHMASQILQFAPEHLVEDAWQEKRPLYVIYRGMQTVRTGSNKYNAGLYGLYLIVEGNNLEPCKLGHGSVARRFDELQEGNPRRLRLRGF